MLAGRGDKPVQSTYPGVLFDVHNLLGVVALRCIVCPSACTEPRFISFEPLCRGESSVAVEWERRDLLTSFIGKDADRF
jgi:hypothetical protein